MLNFDFETTKFADGRSQGTRSVDARWSALVDALQLVAHQETNTPSAEDECSSVSSDCSIRPSSSIVSSAGLSSVHAAAAPPVATTPHAQVQVQQQQQQHGPLTHDTHLVHQRTTVHHALSRPVSFVHLPQQPQMQVEQLPNGQYILLPPEHMPRPHEQRRRPQKGHMMPANGTAKKQNVPPPSHQHQSQPVLHHAPPPPPPHYFSDHRTVSGALFGAVEWRCNK